MDKFKSILNITFTLVLTLFLLVFTASTGFGLYTRVTERQIIDQIDGEQVRCFTWRDSISCFCDSTVEADKD